MLNSTIEQKIADQLFLRHDMVLSNGYVDGVNVGLEFVETMTSGYGYFNRYSGKIQVRVGPRFSNHVRSVGFRQKKDGTHSYDKIADKLFSMRDTVKRHNDFRILKAQTRDANDNAQARILKRLGVSKWNSNLTVNFDHGNMLFKMGSLNEEQGEKFMALGIELGLIKTEK